MNGIGSTLVTQLPSIPTVCVNPKLTPNKLGVLNEKVSNCSPPPSSLLHFQSSLKKPCLIEGDGKSPQLASDEPKADDPTEIIACRPSSMDQSTRHRRNRHAPKSGAGGASGDGAAAAGGRDVTLNKSVLGENKIKGNSKDSKTLNSATLSSNESSSSGPQPKTDSTAVDRHEKPAKWLVGDLIWSKVSGHPWWPCLIACDPLEGVYTKLRVKGKGSVRNYHVQYFYDEPERAWVSENSTLGFEGKDKFFKYVEDMLERAPAKQRSQISQKYGVSKHKRPVWDRAVRLAEAALPLSHVERKMRYITNLSKQTENDKAAVKSSTQQSLSVAEEPEKVRNATSKPTNKVSLSKTAKQNKTENNKLKTSDDNDDDSVLSSPSVLNGTLAKKRNLSTAVLLNDSVGQNFSPQRKKPKISGSGCELGVVTCTAAGPKTGKDDGSFDMFCQKHREGVLSEHADFDDQMVVEYLRQQWSMMSQKQKARYKSKFGGGGVGGGGGGGGSSFVTSRTTTTPLSGK